MDHPIHEPGQVALDGPTIHPHRYYAPRQVAELLGLSSQTLAGWRVDRRGPAYVKLSPKIVRYLGADLLAYLESSGARCRASSIATGQGVTHHD